MLGNVEQETLGKELKESIAMDKFLKSHGATSVPLNSDLAGYWFPSPFLSE